MNLNFDFVMPVISVKYTIESCLSLSVPHNFECWD